MEPSLIFIIPYRNREPQKEFFLRHMKYILEDFKNEYYEIVIAHQCDNRNFNRGAMKNIGFQYIKNKYPRSYKTMTFIFNDVDTIPYKKNLIDYKTGYGKIKHFYGFEYALGGIFSISGNDFEILNGFPNFWGWGCEDNVINDRATRNGIYISRKNFFNIGDSKILHLFDGYIKPTDTSNPYLTKNDNGSFGLNTLTDIKFDIDMCNSEDGLLQHTMVNINNFNCEIEHNNDNIRMIDIRKGNRLKITIPKNKEISGIINNNYNSNDNSNDNSKCVNNKCKMKSNNSIRPIYNIPNSQIDKRVYSNKTNKLMFSFK